MTVTAAAATVTAALLWRWWFLPIVPPADWSADLSALCVVVVAAAGRGLLGFSSRTSGESAPRSLWASLFAWPAVAAAAVLVFLPSLRVGLLSDDFGLLWAVRSAGDVRQAVTSQALPFFTRPASMLLWWIGAKAWAGAPVGYHIANVLLHAGNSLLVYAIARRLIGSKPGAGVAGMLFALHPLHVEPVVWASCNADLLCTFFSLLSLLSLEAHLTSASRLRQRLALIAALLSFALALLSKEAALALPAVVALRAALVQREGRWWRTVKVAGWYSILLSGYLAWRIHERGGLGGYPVRLSPYDVMFPRALARHIVSFFFPVNQELFRHVGGPWLSLAVVMMAVALLWAMHHLADVPGRRLVLWSGFLLFMMVPAWALAAAIPDLEGARFAYLPTIGLAWLLGDVCAARGMSWRRGGAVAAIVLLAAAGLTIWYQSPWIEAHVTATRVIASGSGLLKDLEARNGRLRLYVQGLPQAYRGAQVFRNGFPEALSVERGRWARVREVKQNGYISPRGMAWSVLLAGDYLAAWDEQSGRFNVLRSGGVSAKTPR